MKRDCRSLATRAAGLHARSRKQLHVSDGSSVMLESRQR